MELGHGSRSLSTDAQRLTVSSGRLGVDDSDIWTLLLLLLSMSKRYRTVNSIISKINHKSFHPPRAEIKTLPLVIVSGLGKSHKGKICVSMVPDSDPHVYLSNKDFLKEI